MITEDDVAKHAGFPLEQRFYLTERLARERLAEARREADRNSWPAYDEHDYMIEIMAAAEAFGIAELQDWELPSQNDQDCESTCRRFRAQATKISQRLMFRYAGRPDPNTVALNPATKERLRFHLGQVRSIVDKDPMPDWKKQELYGAIAQLEREIDKSRTRIAVVVEVLGKAWDGEMRAVDALRQIITIIQDAKATEKEQERLAAPVEPKQLEPPKPKVSSTPKVRQRQNGFDKPIDDEIPF